jgi:hypothetical protein
MEHRGDSGVRNGAIPGTRLLDESIELSGRQGIEDASHSLYAASGEEEQRQHFHHEFLTLGFREPPNFICEPLYFCFSHTSHLMFVIFSTTYTISYATSVYHEERLLFTSD